MPVKLVNYRHKLSYLIILAGLWPMQVEARTNRALPEPVIGLEEQVTADACQPRVNHLYTRLSELVREADQLVIKTVQRCARLTDPSKKDAQVSCEKELASAKATKTALEDALKETPPTFIAPGCKNS